MNSWGKSQFLKLRTLVEILITLLLDAVLILAVWGIRTLLIMIIGVDPNCIKDKTLFWIVRISEVGTVIILAAYIIGDITRHLLKTYDQIKKDVVIHVGTKRVQTEIE